MLVVRSVPGRSYRQYSRYREQVRRDFRGHCAYCFISDLHAGGSESFDIDHYCPVNVAPLRIADFANLYWSCRGCNRFKWHYYPSKSQLRRGERLCDPCKADPCGRHYRLEASGQLVPLTKAGRLTIARIRLNRPRLVVLRERWLVALAVSRELAAIERSGKASQDRRLGAALARARRAIDGVSTAMFGR